MTKSSSHAMLLYLQEAVMLFQIFVLEARPNLQETKADETHSHVHEHTLAAATWQQPAEDAALNKSPPTAEHPVSLQTPTRLAGSEAEEQVELLFQLIQARLQRLPSLVG